MSAVEQVIRDAFADPAVDFVSVGRTRQGDFSASVKRGSRGYAVFYGPDPCAALVKALTAPDGVGRVDAAFAAAKAAALAAGRIAVPPEPASAAVDDDLFG